MKRSTLSVPASAVLLLAALLTTLPLTAQVDMTRYVAIGDSLTAGFSSSGWVNTVQANSYPALLSQQATNGVIPFEQPLISPPGIPAPLQLATLVPGVSFTVPAGSGQPLNLFLQRPYNNLAVPGADVNDVLSTVSDGGLHDLVLRGLGTQLEQGIFLQPTFVSLWIGNNDVLGAATSGLVIEGVTITPAAEFQAKYATIAGALASTGARMVLANLPNVTSIPYVTTVPPVVVNPATNEPVLVGGAPVPLIGPNGPLSLADSVLLPATTLLGQGIGIPAQLGGTGLPLPDQVILDANEKAIIADRVNAYNSIIAATANQLGAAFVDINSILTELQTEGIIVGGVDFGTDFLTGGVFSYDGVHPTSFGYAYIANEFIDAINATFQDDIPYVNLAPFIFGGAGGGGGALPVTAAQAAQAKISAKGWQNLLWTLGVDNVQAPQPAPTPEPEGPSRQTRVPRG